jgi:hypothetical protein
MKALAIVAVVLSGVSIIVPVFGASYMPIAAGIMALIAVRAQPTLSFVALGINIVNVAFLSPILLVASAVAGCGSEIMESSVDMMNSLEDGVMPSMDTPDCGAGGMYYTYLLIHIGAAAIAGVLAYMSKKS